MTKRKIADALLWCVMAGLLVIGAINAGAIKAYSPVSLRYDAPISGQDAYRAREYSIRHSGENVFWPTFWHETEANYSNEYRNIKAFCILYSGDAALVRPLKYMSGTTPGSTDGTGCAVSSALAWELWGSFDVVGKTVGVGSEDRLVLGVFDEKELLALVSVGDEDKDQSFTAVELAGGLPSPARADAESYAVAAGLGKPDSILLGTPATLAAILTAAPLLILGVYGLALCAGRIKKHPAALKGAIFFAAFIGFAMLLPSLLGIFPDRIIPTRWSDFSFWGALTRQTGENLKEYLAQKPYLRDVEYKILLLKQICITFISVICAVAICFRWGRGLAGFVREMPASPPLSQTKAAS